MSSFADFIAAIHGERRPRLWQTRAAEELAAHGWWPALRAPTGAGKTTLIECWLYALAQAGPERLGRRLVWVVDRRSVVDQVFDHARHVVEHLSGDVLDQLKRIGGGAAPTASLWRGGLDDEASIAMRDPIEPAQIAIVVSTVDQFGSRLLFRGYGLGTGSRALHAGLLGLDTAVILDEAHLSEPLRATVKRVQEIQGRAPRAPRPALRLCPISATHDVEGAFELLPHERDEEGMRSILAANKQARLSSSRPSAIAKLVTELADGGAKVIGVVLNTVAEARAAFGQLDGDRLLLIGPIRPLDRVGLLDRIPARGAREALERPFVVVATQTIEVGVDLDFDALITACAPASALVQRFGRLDRRGGLGETQAIVLAPPSRGCPVYGQATADAWDWLQQVAREGAVNFGIDALAVAQQPPPEPEVPMIRLLDLHVGALAVTDALEHEGPSIELLLHGNREVSPEVSVIWRALSEHPSPDEVQVDIGLRPPHPDEALTLSLNAFRRWLMRLATPQLSDVESVAEESPPDGWVRRAWRIDGSAVQRIGRSSDVRPGDRIVVHAADGGVDGFGWAPEYDGPVVDLGSLARHAPRVILDDGIEDIVSALGAGEAVTRKELERPLEAALATQRQGYRERVDELVGELVTGAVSLLDDGRVLVTGPKVRTEFGAAGGVVPLAVHQRDVCDEVAAALEAVGLDGGVAASLTRAALHHDEGKRDPRFQAWLKGGKVVNGAVAKSVYRYQRQRVLRLRDAAGWPARKCHELLSAMAVMARYPDDRLAVWLVATHHGRNRPFPRAVDDDCADIVDLQVDGQSIGIRANAVPPIEWQLGSFIELSREFGPWGLAYLEALVVGADRRVSGRERGRADG